MATGIPPDDKQECFEECLQECLAELPLQGEETTDEDESDGMLSLLEENARLRGLVVKLTGMILKNVAERS